MRRHSINYLYLTLFVLIFVQSSSAVAQEALRILTYNVRNCRGLDNYSSINSQRVADVIARQPPDLAGIQELDNKTTRSQDRNILQELAEGTKLAPTYGPAIEFQGGQYGVGILSKDKPISVRTVPLPGQEEKRVLLIAEFSRYVFFCTHLSLTAASRQESVEIINEERQKYASKPVILVGDLNATPDSPVVQTLRKSWTQASGNDFTFSADKPFETIDYVFVSCPQNVRFSVKSTQVVEEAVASDHRPVLTEIEIP